MLSDLGALAQAGLHSKCSPCAHPIRPSHASPGALPSMNTCRAPCPSTHPVGSCQAGWLLGCLCPTPCQLPMNGKLLEVRWRGSCTSSLPTPLWYPGSRGLVLHLVLWRGAVLLGDSLQLGNGQDTGRDSLKKLRLLHDQGACLRGSLGLHFSVPGIFNLAQLLINPLCVGSSKQ